MQVRNLRHAIARNNLPRAPKFLDIHHFNQEHNAPCLTPRILHNHCKMLGVSKVHYGLGENSEYWQLEATMASSCGFWYSIYWQYPEVFLKMIFDNRFEGACLEIFFLWILAYQLRVCRTVVSRVPATCKCSWLLVGAWENHFPRSTGFPANIVMTTTQIWVVLLIGWSKFLNRLDQSEALPRSR